MKIEQVDDLGRLYQVSEVFPDTIVNQILSLDWEALPWNRENQQEMWARKSIDKYAVPVLLKASEYIAKMYPWFEERFGIKFEFPPNAGNTNWWVDLPGFTTPMHTDGELPMSMQLYFIGSPELGTAFFKHRTPESIWKKFEFKPNTGYVMLNGPLPDGSQPLHWHEMMTPVPQNSIRVSSYTVFSQYSNK